MNYNQDLIKQELVDRFIRYAKIDTTSDRNIEEIPSTPGQWDLLKLLEKELTEMGVQDISLDEYGYLIARLPASGAGKSADTGGEANDSKKAPTIGLMAHVDTASDVSGKNVKPQLFADYRGGDLQIGNGHVLKADENPSLSECPGDTIITSDGTTLLGADDKAGVVEIMTAVKWLREHPEIEHGPLEIIFTPDEETGKGMNRFPIDQLQSTCCYTFDGGERGSIESECFNASVSRVIFTGNVVHLGIARGKLENAVTMASQFVSMLPRNESPEATDGRYGYLAPLEIKGDLEQSEVIVYLRDFEKEGIERREEVIRRVADSIRAVFPGGKVKVENKYLYSNMREHIAKNPMIMDLLEQAIRRTGIEPVRKIIRGGTDGSRLSEMGIPTPNVFTGGHNFHSRLEWASLDTMEKAVETALNLVQLWGKAENS